MSLDEGVSADEPVEALLERYPELVAYFAMLRTYDYAERRSKATSKNGPVVCLSLALL